MNEQQALEIIADAINKAIQCNIHNKAEIVGIQMAFEVVKAKVTEKTKNE